MNFKTLERRADIANSAIITCAAAYLTAEVLAAPVPTWLKIPVTVIGTTLAVLSAAKIRRLTGHLNPLAPVNRRAQVIASRLHLIRIISAYEFKRLQSPRDPETVRCWYRHRESKVILLPFVGREDILAYKTKMMFDQIAADCGSVVVYEERYIGEHENV